MISGDFGEVTPPNQNQVAIVWNKAGGSTVARRLQEDGDTLFMQTLEFDIVPIPLDSVSKIEIRSQSPLEMTGQEHKAEEEQAKEAVTGIALRGAILLIAIVPFLVLGWVVTTYLGSVSK